QVFTLGHADVSRAEQIIKPFLTQPGGNSVPFAEQRMLIVTDYASNLPRVAELIALIDRPQRPVEVRFVPVRNVEAAQLAPQVAQILTAKSKTQGGPAAAGAGGEIVDVSQDSRTNQLIVIGTAAAVADAAEVVK